MRVKRKRTIHIFSLVSTLLLVVSLTAAVGAFLYSDYLDRKLENVKGDLVSARSSRNTDMLMDEVRVYHEKLSIAENLIENHLAPSRLLAEIEDSTKETVQYTTLEYKYDPGFEVLLTLGGNTSDFASVALQKMEILDGEFFTDFVLKDISNSGGDDEPGASRQASGKEYVTFNVTGLFKKDYIGYTGVGASTSATLESTAAPATPRATSSDSGT